MVLSRHRINPTARSSRENLNPACGIEQQRGLPGVRFGEAIPLGQRTRQERSLFLAFSRRSAYIHATLFLQNHQIMSLLLVIILLAVLFLVSTAFVILVIGPLIILQPIRRTKEWYRSSTNLLEPRDAALPQEDVSLVSTDGLRLSGWFVPSKRKPKGTIIYLHGLGDCKTAGVTLTRVLHKAGFHVLLYDSREHGESEGSYCTYGYNEKYDVSTAIDFVKKKRIRTGEIGIFGTSMGAAVAIQAAAVDHRIKAVAAEASFTDLRRISVDYQRRIVKLPWHFLRNVAMSRSQKIAQFKARDVSPINDVRKLSIPILFNHGMDDRLINYEYSKTLYHHANEPKDLFLVPGANHQDLWEVAGSSYENNIIDFFRRWLH